MIDPKLDHLNPYAPPEASLERPEPTFVDERAVALRRKNLGHENAVRTLGIVHFICAAVDAMLVAIGLYSTLGGSGAFWDGMSPQTRVDWVAQSFVATPPLILMHLFLGWGLRRRESWAFRGQVALSVVVLVGFIATLSWELLGGLIPDFSPLSKFAFGIAHFGVLYYLLASNCRRIFEPNYQATIDATPDLEHRRSWWLLVGLVPFSLAFDWGVLVSAWKTALAIVGVLGLKT